MFLIQLTHVPTFFFFSKTAAAFVASSMLDSMYKMKLISAVNPVIPVQQMSVHKQCMHWQIVVINMLGADDNFPCRVCRALEQVHTSSQSQGREAQLLFQRFHRKKRQ